MSSGKYGKMSKKVNNNDKWSSYIAEKGLNWWKMKDIIFFWISSGKYGKMSKIVKNDENGSDIDEKSQNWWQIKKEYLCRESQLVKIKTEFENFSSKYGKESKE